MLFGGSDFLFPLKQSQDTTTYWRFTFPEHYETQTLTLLEHRPGAGLFKASGSSVKVRTTVVQ